jgi:hypothetical protein
MGGVPGQRGDFSVVNYPDRFNTTIGWRMNVKETVAEVLAFDNVSPLVVPTVSDTYSVGSTQGFTVYKTGSGDVLVQGSPDGNIWVTLETLGDNPDSYENTDPHVYIRLSAAAGATNIFSWIFRKYATY